MLPKYVKRVRSRGKDYYYFDTGKRVEGKKQYARLPDIRDPGFGGSLAALQGHRNRRPADVRRVPAVIEMYRRSDAFNKLSPASQKVYHIYLDRFERLLPTAPIAELRRSDMYTLFDSMSATPGAANAFIRTASAMFVWALKRDFVAVNPCVGVDKNDSEEHPPWPDHILGAALKADDRRVRILTHLLYYTAQRISDVLKMTWDDIQDGRVAVVQRKTKKKLRVRLHDGLAAELARYTPGDGPIYQAADGKPMKQGTAASLLSDFTKARGHRCVPHGLRKNAVISLLEAGCTVAQTAAVSGQSLRMVEHYAKERNQVLLGDAAIAKWQGNQS